MKLFLCNNLMSNTILIKSKMTEKTLEKKHQCTTVHTYIDKSIRN